jgi:hypothetical protein
MKNTTTEPLPAVPLDRLVRIFRWVTLNCLVAWCAWSAILNGNVGAGRVLRFTVWVFAIMTLMGACAPSVAAKIRNEGRSVPAWMSVGCGISLLAFFVWNGWWTTAVGMLLMEMGEASIYHDPNVGREQSAPGPGSATQ